MHSIRSTREVGEKAVTGSLDQASGLFAHFAMRDFVTQLPQPRNVRDSSRSIMRLKPATSTTIIAASLRSVTRVATTNSPYPTRKAKAVGRKTLFGLDTIVSPDTLLRWHRRLVAQKWNFAERRGAGRPGIMRHISELIVRMAQENPRWGYTRIQGALASLSHKVGRGTIANVFKRNGIEPSPERSRRMPWSTFLRAHWKVLAASDFLTVEV